MMQHPLGEGRRQKKTSRQPAQTLEKNKIPYFLNPVFQNPVYDSPMHVIDAICAKVCLAVQAFVPA